MDDLFDILAISIIGEDEPEEINNTGGSRTEKVQKQLKSHLNGLYNGLSKIMLTTCNLNRRQETNRAPFSVEKAIHNIMFIKHHMKRQDEFDAVRDKQQTHFGQNKYLIVLFTF